MTITQTKRNYKYIGWCNYCLHKLLSGAMQFRVFASTVVIAGEATLWAERRNLGLLLLSMLLQKTKISSLCSKLHSTALRSKWQYSVRYFSCEKRDCRVGFTASSQWRGRKCHRRCHCERSDAILGYYRSRDNRI